MRTSRLPSRRTTLATSLVVALLVLVPAVALAVVGDFTQPPTSPEAAGKIPSSVAAGNFNGDAHTDLAVTNKDGSNLTILLGDGAGDFTAAGTSPEAVGGSPWRAAAGDFDEDGDDDLGVVLHEDKAVILMNDGKGDFVATGNSPITVGGMPRNIVAADLDGDTDTDLAVANFFPATVSILLNDGSGSFAVTGTLNAGGSPTNASSIVAADLNGDTEIDLAVGNEFSNELRVFLNDAEDGAVFTMLTPVESGFDANSLTAGNFDGDADIDLAAADGSTTKTVAILLNNGSGDFTFAPNSPEALPVVAWSILTANIDGDSSPDLVATGGASSGQVMLLLNNGSADFTAPPSSPEAAGNLPTWAAAANLGGSAATDLAIANTNSSNVTILLNDFAPGTGSGGGGTGTGGGSGTGGGGSTDPTPPAAAVLPPPGQVKPPETKKACGKGKVRKNGKCVPKCPKKKTLKKGKCVKKKSGRKRGK